MARILLVASACAFVVQVPRCQRRPRALMGPEVVEEAPSSRFQALELRALTASSTERRGPFFARRSMTDSEMRGLLEAATTAVLRLAALGLTSDQVDDVAPLRTESASAQTRAYADALMSVAETGAVDDLVERFFPEAVTSPFAVALKRLKAEVDASRTDVDLCLSLADRMDAARSSMTRTLNTLSNDLLRAASYGQADDVVAARDALQEQLLQPMPAEAAAYVEALVSLARPQAETAARAAIVDAALETFFLERATPLADRLGDAYSVALQRVLGELTRRGAIAGAPSSETVVEDAPRASVFGGRLGFNFIEWEMRLRRDLAASRDPKNGLQPRDFVGKWQLVLIDDVPSQPFVASPDLIADADDVFDITLQADGAVAHSTLPYYARPNLWRVRPGPAHLDTCEFSVNFDEETTIDFRGYVDRGQRIESRFSSRPIRVSGFAFTQDDDSRRPSGRFAM